VARADLETLREEVARLERGSSPAAAERFTTGSQAMDAALGGGIARGALHEIFAEGLSNEPAAAAFAVALALRAPGRRPILWVRQDFVGLEMGEIYAPGLAELGLSPDRLILVRARDGPAVLRAGEEAARCPPLGSRDRRAMGQPQGARPGCIAAAVACGRAFRTAALHGAGRGNANAQRRRHAMEHTRRTLASAAGGCARPSLLHRRPVERPHRRCRTRLDHGMEP